MLPQPSPDQLSRLRPTEKLSFRVADTVNRYPVLKSLGHFYLKTFGATWVEVCTRSLRHELGIEHIRSLAPDRGVVVISNHRSFFDLYVMSSVLLRNSNWVERMYFPVRSEFFYEGPAGVAVNAVMSAMAMYPPVLRRPEARAFNDYMVDALVSELQRPGTVVGMHPEGTRGKGPNPYELLPAQPGVGQLVHRTRALVVPVFVLGLGNDFVRQVKSNFDGTGSPITVTFGPPVDLGALLEEPPRLRTYKAISDTLRQSLVQLGAEERKMRKQLNLPSLIPDGRSTSSAS